MREHVEALRALFTMEEVTYDGEFVDLDGSVSTSRTGTRHRATFRSTSAPTGEKMMELTGEICEGVVLNYVVPVPYIRSAVELLARGQRRSGRTSPTSTGRNCSCAAVGRRS